MSGGGGRIVQRTAMVDRPGAVLRFLYRGLFESVQLDEEAVSRIRAAAARGPVVYVLPSVSYMAYLYFNYALSRLGLPLARFANGEVRTVLLWPLFIAVRLLVGLWRLARGSRLEPPEDTVTRLVDAGEAVLLFLRPARILVEEPGEAARVRGRFFEALVALARRRVAAGQPAPQLVPMTLVLGQPPVRSAGPRGSGRGTIGTIFGEQEAPGRTRAFLQFVWHRKRSAVKVAEPIDLAAVVREADGRSDEALARTLRFEASGAIERERRVLMGPPAKSARRLRLDVLRSRRLVRTVDELAARPGAPPREALVKRAGALVREIAAYPRQWTFNLFRRALAIVFNRMYEGIDVDEAGIERVREAAHHGPLVLLPSHKSHVDYLILSYVFYERGLAPPHIAAGKNLSFFPMGFLFRRCAAFFLRRSFRGDELYAAVFDAYVRRLLRDGYSMEFFIEGGRSRTGKVLPPRFGLLGMVADAAIDGDAPGAQVVPIAIAYEKIVEEKSYQKELAGGAKSRENLGALLRAGRVLGARYGRIELTFGEPFDLAQALADAGAGPGADEAARKRAVARLGHRVAYEIASVTAVTPTALVSAAALASGRRAMPLRELEQAVRFLHARCAEGGARFSAACVADLDGAIERTIRRMVSSGDLDLRGHDAEALVVVPFERRPKLEYYKNNLIHALADLSIVARAMLAAPAGAAEAEVRERALAASRLLKRELIFRPGKGFDRAFAETCAWIERLGLRGRADELLLLAGLTGSYVESYALVAHVARASKPSKEAPMAKLLSMGERLLLLGELTRREALSRPVLESAWRAVGDAGSVDWVAADLAAAGAPVITAPVGRAQTVT